MCRLLILKVKLIQHFADILICQPYASPLMLADVEFALWEIALIVNGL
jgi:hypothetical protein